MIPRGVYVVYAYRNAIDAGDAHWLLTLEDWIPFGQSWQLNEKFSFWKIGREWEDDD
jgi:hypothetical protein